MICTNKNYILLERIQDLIITVLRNFLRDTKAHS